MPEGYTEAHIHYLLTRALKQDDEPPIALLARALHNLERIANAAERIANFLEQKE